VSSARRRLLPSGSKPLTLKSTLLLQVEVEIKEQEVSPTLAPWMWGVQGGDRYPMGSKPLNPLIYSPWTSGWGVQSENWYIRSISYLGSMDVSCARRRLLASVMVILEHDAARWPSNSRMACFSCWLTWGRQDWFLNSGVWLCKYILVVHSFLVNVSTEHEMSSDTRQNGGKAHFVKHCKCA